MELHAVKRKCPVDRNTTTSSSSTSTSTSTSILKTDGNTIALFNADARLMAEFDQSAMSGNFFNYCKSVPFPPKTNSSEVDMTTYLTKIQRGGFVQSFGCMIVIEEPSFSVIGYSENCFDMLGLKGFLEGKSSLIGIDAKTLFTAASTASLAKAVASREISFLNPIFVHSRSNHRPFYAIVHRIDVGIVIDLEPGRTSDPVAVHAGAVQSQKLAVRAISRLQSLPGGDVGALCDTLVEDVQRLTGYDRVMVYKFHEDNHGEVVAEIRRSDLEPYLGLHYPATDIPQAARFLFKQNRVRLIHDCKSEPVKVIQSEKLKHPLCLVNSTLRAPHVCHTQYMGNMGSIASLAMAVVVKDGDSTKLWGLVVCHHTSPRYVTFPLRYACEFLMQAFNLQLYTELQMASQMAEKKILQMQTLLSDMLLRDAPHYIVTQSPNIMDLVKCDGAALYYGGKCWLLGVTPTEAQLNDIVEWLLNTLGDATGFSTDGLVAAGYPGAALLGDAVCGMAAARISTHDFLFWFRSHTAKQFKWGGAKHHLEDKDDGEKMHPRSSFNAFLEVAKSKSMPWETYEINAIHSLQIIMRDSFQESEDSGHKPGEISQRNDSNGPKLDDLTVVATEMARFIETANAPIFGVDLSGLINGWNGKMCELTGLELLHALGKSLIPDVIHEDSHDIVKNLLAGALKGEEIKNVEVKLRKFGVHALKSAVYLLVNACTSRDYKNDVVGVCFVGQDVTNEKALMDNFIRMQGDYKAIIQSVNPLIPPIFASDENACCSEWNAVMEKLTGWMRHEIIGKTLPGEIFGSLCRLKSQDVLTKFMILLYRTISGHDTEKLAFGFFNQRGEFVEAYLTAYKRENESGKIIGCLCFLQTIVISKKESKQEEHEQSLIGKELAYITQEMKNPLNGIRFTHTLLEGSTISDDQKKFLETSHACERQILSIIDQANFGSLEEDKIELKVEEFLLDDVVNAIVSQAMILLREKDLHLVLDIHEQIKCLRVYGDQMKLQLALSDLLICIVDYSPSRDGWVEINVSPGLKLIHDGDEFVHLKFRMVHPGQGLPYPLIEDMFGTKNHWATHEGMVLNISQNLLSLMNGNVRYIREQNQCYFEIELELRSRDPRLHGSNR